jgi:hypothetical protein
MYACHSRIAWGHENALFLLKEKSVDIINWKAGSSSTLYHHKVMSGMPKCNILIKDGQY